MPLKFVSNDGFIFSRLQVTVGFYEVVLIRENHQSADGILVPGGFGDRGVQGKILAAKYARESRTPFLGVCLGMQIAVIEFARYVLGMEGANSTEFDPETPHPCVVFMPEVSKTHMGGTMRLGSRRTYFESSDSMTSKLYNNGLWVDERHRHRYEVNPAMVEKLEKAGLKFVGKDESGQRMEVLELPSHPYYVGVQFHPEFKSRPGKPSAVFLGLTLAASGQLQSFLQGSLLPPLNKILHKSNGHAVLDGDRFRENGSSEVLSKQALANGVH